MKKENLTVADLPGPYTVPLESVHSDPNNHRKTFPEATMQQLAASIKEKGIIQRPVVRVVAGRLVVVAGERRLRAARLAGLTEIPIEVRALTDEEAEEIQLIENDQREDVHYLQRAEAYAELSTVRKLTPAEIAARVGKDEKYVTQIIRLNSLTPKSRKRCLKENLSAGIAFELCRLDPKTQDAVPDHVFRDFESLRRWVNNEALADLTKMQFSKTDPNLVPEAGNCVDCPKRTGNAAMLFPDVRGGDTCTDRTCLQKKVHANLAAALAADPALVKISQNSNTKGAVYKYSVNIQPKPGKDRTKGILIDGYSLDEVGAIVYFQKPQGRASNPEASRQREQDKKAKLAKRIKAQVLRTMVENANLGPRGPLGLLNFELLWAAYLRTGSEDQVQVVRAMGGIWEEELKEKESHNRTPNERKLRKKLEAADAKTIERFKVAVVYAPLVQTFAYNNTDSSRAELYKAAKLWKVDPAKVERLVLEEIEAKKKKPAAKAQGKPKAKKPTSGVCSECGCTESTPCITAGEPCGWVDKKKTLCTACQKKIEKGATRAKK